jgi:hypothetical protein
MKREISKYLQLLLNYKGLEQATQPSLLITMIN